jgi:hypothetical protein
MYELGSTFEKTYIAEECMFTDDLDSNMVAEILIGSVGIGVIIGTGTGFLTAAGINAYANYEFEKLSDMYLEDESHGVHLFEDDVGIGADTPIPSSGYAGMLGLVAGAAAGGTSGAVIGYIHSKNNQKTVK